MYPELKQGMRRPQDRYAWTNSMRPKGPVTMPYWMIFVHSISCGTCHNMQVGNISLMRNRLDRSESPGYCCTQTSADSYSSHSWPDSLRRGNWKGWGKTELARWRGEEISHAQTREKFLPYIDPVGYTAAAGLGSQGLLRTF